MFDLFTKIGSIFSSVLEDALSSVNFEDSIVTDENGTHIKASFRDDIFTDEEKDERIKGTLNFWKGIIKIGNVSNPIKISIKFNDETPVEFEFDESLNDFVKIENQDTPVNVVAEEDRELDKKDTVSEPEYDINNAPNTAHSDINEKQMTLAEQIKTELLSDTKDPDDEDYTAEDIADEFYKEVKSDNYNIFSDDNDKVLGISIEADQFFPEFDSLTNDADVILEDAELLEDFKEIVKTRYGFSDVTWERKDYGSGYVTIQFNFIF